MDPTCVVRCKQDWEGFHEFHNVYLIVIEYDLILKLHELIIPDKHFTVSASSCYQSKIMTVVSTNNVLFVAHCLLSHDIFFCLLLLISIILVDLNGLIPSCCDDGEVLIAIADKGNLTILFTMWIEGVDGNSAKNIEDLDFSKMTSNN